MTVLPPPLQDSSSGRISRIVSIFFHPYFLPNFFSFHFLQFLSILLQYSLLYLLSLHPNKALAVYLPGNSPLSYIPLSSSLSYCLMSSISLLYFFSKSFNASLTFLKFSLPSYVFASNINPFHCTKNFSFALAILLLRIFLTSHSSSPSITTSHGISFFCPSNWSLYLCTLLTLTTRCIFTVLDSSNSITFVEIILFTLYGPTNLSVSFSVLLLTIWSFKSFVLNSTQCYSYPQDLNQQTSQALC